MAQYFRMVSNRRYWDKPIGEGYEWLDTSSLPSDAITQIRSEDNKLSIFLVKDDEQIERVVAAMAMGRGNNKINRLDFVLIEEEFIKHNDFRIDESKGNTHDSEVNTWHKDIVELDSKKALILADYFFNSGKVRRFLPVKVRDLLERYYSGSFDN